MNAERLVPLNDLEACLFESQTGSKSMSDFLRMLVDADLFMVSAEPVNAGAKGIHPLFFDRDGILMASVFTEISRANRVMSTVKSIVKLKGRYLFRSVPSGYGIVINPGFDVGMELLPDGLSEVVNKYC